MEEQSQSTSSQHTSDMLIDYLGKDERGAYHTLEADEALDRFMSWSQAQGIDLWDHQIDALLSIAAGNHVILGTPTGSGKSMVALGMAYMALAQDKVMYYTAPIKALVSEKFFNLVDLFGKEYVGMITGDVVINSEAPLICCTAEILAMDAMRWGTEADIACVCMDEFHYYGDSKRGWAWQVPLLTLPNTQFLLMSATLGDTTHISRALTRDTHKTCELIDNAPRPVPLSFTYVTTSLEQTVKVAIESGQAPIYIVHFSQDQAFKSAQGLASFGISSKEQREKIKASLKEVRFTTAFGKTLKRLLLCGVGIHHAGMLPRYRLCVERLAQKGLLPVICGTDTLGVGINVPIHTVLFSALSKYDGHRMRHLRVREFLQIAGRAGRAGFDDEGVVISLATPYDIERMKAEAKAQGDPKKLRKIKVSTPPEGYVGWSEKTFEMLKEGKPEALKPHLVITHALILAQMQQGGDAYRRIVDIIERSQVEEAEKLKLYARAQEIIATLLDAQVIERIPRDKDDVWGEAQYSCSVDMPEDFALDQPLSPFVLAAIELLDETSDTYALDVISLVEASVENPVQIMKVLLKQARSRAWEQMKLQGIDYDERLERIEDVTYEQPLKDLIDEAYEHYCAQVPWARDYIPQPKSIVRSMVECAADFKTYIQQIGIARSEGLLLRYLSDVWRVLTKTIPEVKLTEELEDIIAWLQIIVRTTDSSLIDEWAQNTQEEKEIALSAPVHTLIPDRRGLTNLVRRAMFLRVRMLATQDIDALAQLDEAWGWHQRKWQEVSDAYFAEHESILLTADARAKRMCTIDDTAEETQHIWRVRQMFLDENNDCDYGILADVDVVQTQEEGELVCARYCVGTIEELTLFSQTNELQRS